MSRLVPLLGLGLIAGGILYWRRRQAGTPPSEQGNSNPASVDPTPPASMPEDGAPAPARSNAGAAPASLPLRIKGNVHGERQLYHLPEDDSYDHVLEERLFATVEEAEAAGFRHAGHTRD
jgi:hypothetical protein